MMKSEPGQQGAPAEFSGFVVADAHGLSLDRLRAEINARVIFADMILHTKAALSAARVWLEKPRDFLPTGIISGEKATRWRRRGQDILDLSAGFVLLGLLPILMLLRGSTRRKTRGARAGTERAFPSQAPR